MNKVNDYFRDPVYMLELNLQRIRRELIQLLDDSEENECFICNRLKCCCVDTSSVKSSTLSILTPVPSRPSSKNSCNSAEDPASNPVAPPAESLPKPEWRNKGVAAWIRASTSTPNLDPNNEPSKDVNESQNISNISQDVKPSAVEVQNNATTSEVVQSNSSTGQVVKINPSTCQEIHNNPNTSQDVNSPNVSQEIKVKVAKANVSLQPAASNMNQKIRILSRSTPNISQGTPKVAQNQKGSSQDGKQPDGKTWPKTIWNEWNQLDDGVRWPGVGNQNPEASVEAFFKSFSEVAGNSSAVGYSYF